MCASLALNASLKGHYENLLFETVQSSELIGLDSFLNKFEIIWYYSTYISL